MDAQRALRAALAAIDRGGAGVARSDLLTMRCKTLTTLALTDFLLSGLPAAERRFAQASRVVAELGDDDLGARLAYQRANVHGRAGDLASASDGIEAAVARLSAFTPVERCSVFLSRGMLALETGDPDLALASFHESATIAETNGFLAQAQMSRHNEGFARYLLGDLPGALTTMAEAAEIETDFSNAPPLLDRGRVLLEAGLVSEAVEVLHAGARSVTGVAGDGQDQLRAEFDLELARAEQLHGRRDLAAEAADRARATFARLGATAWAGRASLAGLMAALDQQARHRDAGGARSLGHRTARRADALVRTATSLGDLRLADNARVAAAAALFFAGDLTAAQSRLTARTAPPVSLSDELNVSGVTAAVLAASGEPGKARRLLSRAARRLEAGQRGSASLDVRTARSIHGTWLCSLDLRLALAHGAPAVLATLERWRSATDRLPSLGRPADVELAGLTERLRLTYRRIRAEERPDPELERDAARLQLQIRARDWALSAGAGSASGAPIRIREAREVLADADRDLVWLFAVGDHMWGVGIVRGRATIRQLMPLGRVVELAHRVRADLRVAATQRLGALGPAVWGSLRGDAAELDDALMRPWRLAAAGLVLVTSHEVSALPWALLPSLAGRPLTVARSLTAFARRDAGSTSQPGTGPWNVHVSVGPAVPRAGAEAGAIAATWGDAAVVARPSRARLLVDALATPGVVHVAAHGTHEVQSPLFSSVALHDGPVFAHELQPTGVRADHVVLSACDVGSVSFRPGEEALGLAASVLALGARSVVAAVSPVPDAVAAAAMVAHHRGLVAGRSSDVALAEAIVATDPVAAAFLNLGGRFVP
ncbi:CHAT domain-containing protein [Intrasporangium sp.]|uniref:CHAT domain-containing protein n=1 Tax=Intrasporangium sp. TaxID=1925024 RepID=UPI003221EEF2